MVFMSKFINVTQGCPVDKRPHPTAKAVGFRATRLIIMLGMLAVLSLSALAAPCLNGLTYFDNGCYDCDGILYKRVGGEIVCITCVEGFEYSNGGCVPIQPPQEKDAGIVLDNLSTKISPENPFLGFILILLLIAFAYHYLYRRLLK